MQFKVFKMYTHSPQMLTFLFNDRSISGDEMACARPNRGGLSPPYYDPVWSIKRYKWP